MTHPPKRDPVSTGSLTFCCPEAQADGVPCISLGRNCEECQHAIAIPEPATRDEGPEKSDEWAV